MDYRGQTAVLSVILVLVGMMFLVPTITEKALAVIHATARGTCGQDNQYTKPRPCEFSLVTGHLDVGQWISQPTSHGTVVTWSTKGAGWVADEKGSVTYSVLSFDKKVQARAELSFENPTFGSNKCGITSKGGWNTGGDFYRGAELTLQGDCTAGKGINAEFTYNLHWPQASLCVFEHSPPSAHYCNPVSERNALENKIAGLHAEKPYLREIEPQH